MNRAYVMGNLAEDPDTMYNAYNFAISRFDIGVSRGVNKQTGERRKTDFVSCVAYGDTADLCEKYLRRGSKVIVEGFIRSRHIFLEGGERYSVSEVVIEKITFLPDVRRYIRLAEDTLTRKYGRKIRINPDAVKDDLEHGRDATDKGVLMDDLADLAEGNIPDIQSMPDRAGTSWTSSDRHSKTGMSRNPENNIPNSDINPGVWTNDHFGAEDE